METITFIVTGQKINAPATGNRQAFFVQHEVASRKLEFVFADSVHSDLADLTPKVAWCNNNQEMDFETPTKTALTEGFKLAWTPSAAALSCPGHFAFNIAFYNTDNTLVWKTMAYATFIARDVGGTPIQFRGNLEQLLALMSAHMIDEDVHTNETEKEDWNAKLGDAPSDGNQYARKDGAWAVVQSAGGTSDYSALTNKPQVNGVTLSGNKSASDLGLVEKVEGKGLSTNDYTNAEKAKLAGVAEGATNVVESTVEGWGFTKNAGTITEIIMNDASQGTSGVIDLGTVITAHQSLDAYRTSLAQDAIDNALGARISNLESLGKFLSTWNAETHKFGTNPEGYLVGQEYTFHRGDYVIVSNVGSATNYIPNGNKYTVASDYSPAAGQYATTTETLNVNDFVFYDGSAWIVLKNAGGGTVGDVQINGTSILQGGIANILDSALEQVKYTAQSLTDGQKAQARTNIGAITLEEYDSTATSYAEGVLYYTVD